ncbi:hypothetical protein NCCP2716_29820 [Sporosarcina sp. NCCP-2716]|uniref:right-handed parallel beta-helix repeat-containing protein n=1 Tax=Sporosarcina sp. NCCP-2716 TaxID=2943679 RepID=UPI00203F8DEF|nr:right-handed parallel beta-helix repeat-containing protein [Sporosarcina sp. NCCP-2716]GKV70484.1 hypothetical protein NCCP2716_29820 [Sporosarcina sp. NCCP-2716]
MAVIGVSKVGEADFKSVGAAVEAARPGDVVEIAEGVYAEPFVVDKPLTLTGLKKKAGAVRLTGAVRVAADGDVVFDGLTFSGGVDSEMCGLLVETGRVELKECLFTEIQGCALQVAAQAKVSAKRTVFRKNLAGISTAGRLVMFGCIVEETVELAQLTVHDGGHAVLTECGVLGGQAEGIVVTGGSRAVLTKSSLIGSAGVQLRAEQDSMVDADSVTVWNGGGAGVSFDASKGVLKDCAFKAQSGAHVQAVNGSDVEMASCTLEDGAAVGVMAAGSSVSVVETLISRQAGDQLVCTERSTVSLQESRILSGGAAGFVCSGSSCTVLGSTFEYNRETQLSALDGSVLTVLDCGISRGKDRGISASGSRLRVSETAVSHHPRTQITGTDESEITLSATIVKDGGTTGVLMKHSVLQAANCTVSGHKGTNVLLGVSAKADIEDCRISHGGKNGVLAGQSGVVSMERTVLFRHDRTQVEADGSAELSLSECEIYDGSAAGLKLRRVGQAAVTDSRLHGHRGDQIVLLECPSVSFKSVQVLDGMKAGLRLEKAAPVMEECRFAKNAGGDLVRTDDSEPVLINTSLAEVRGAATVPGERSLSGAVGTGEAFENPEMLTLLMEELDSYVGLGGVKDKLTRMMNLLEVNRFKTERGLQAGPVTAPHMVFEGNPGTGKTTVARLMGAFFKWVGLLEKGHLVEVKREDLVGTHVGSSEELTKAKIDEAMGGVLFIDEAYSLTSGKNASNDYGMKVIDTLVPAMENHRGKFVVIAAGYPEDMDRFLAANPGMRDRFTETIQFRDYTPDELMRIFIDLCEGSYALTGAAKQAVLHEITARYRTRGSSFGNARMVRTLFGRITEQQSVRIAGLPRELWTEAVLTTLEAEDVERAVADRTAVRYDVPIDEELLARKVAELERLIGLGGVKAEIGEMIELTRYYKQQDVPAEKLVNHTLLIGKPGTGKTAVARILAGIYEALGLLERGELVEVDRSDLVGTHIGETEKRTAEQIERAMGSALFIDEAYTLAAGGDNDYGKKAIDVLLKQMSDRQGEFLVLAAGYEKEMIGFLDSNPGLRRRFGVTLHLDDYTPEELLDITELYSSGYRMTDEAKGTLFRHYRDLYDRRDETFGNAGLAKKIASEMTRKVDYRLAVASRDPQHGLLDKVITVEDVVLLES